MEAKKQADTMVEKDVITERAVDVSGEIYRRADEYSKSMRLRTYNYMDEMLASFRDKMEIRLFKALRQMPKFTNLL